MSGRAAIWTRIVAGLHGEVPGETLEAYRRAGASVYDLMDRVQQERDQMKVEGRSPWEADQATQYQFAFAWNAYVLQTLGDQFIDADYAADPSTVGFLPHVTASQVAAFYDQVEPWVSRANQAASNPAFAPDVHLPAELPHWVEADPCPRAHLAAMMAAVKAIRGRAEVAVSAVEEDKVPADRRGSLGLVRERLAAANTDAEYAVQLWDKNPPQSLHEQIEGNIKKALENYYVLGQILAIPDLATNRSPSPPEAGVGVRRLPLPSESGFNPWCLTDPQSRSQWQRDPKGREAIEMLWRWDPDPQATLQIQAEIDAALARGEIAPDGMHYYCCPWSAVYVVMRPVVIGGRPLRQLQRFTYDVSAEEMGEGGQFKREVLVANFERTDKLDYCDPREGNHDD